MLQTSPAPKFLFSFDAEGRQTLWGSYLPQKSFAGFSSRVLALGQQKRRRRKDTTHCTHHELHPKRGKENKERTGEFKPHTCTERQIAQHTEEMDMTMSQIFTFVFVFASFVSPSSLSRLKCSLDATTEARLDTLKGCVYIAS